MHFTRKLFAASMIAAAGAIPVALALSAPAMADPVPAPAPAIPGIPRHVVPQQRAAATAGLCVGLVGGGGSGRGCRTSRSSRTRGDGLGHAAAGPRGARGPPERACHSRPARRSARCGACRSGSGAGPGAVGRGPASAGAGEPAAVAAAARLPRRPGLADARGHPAGQPPAEVTRGGARRSRGARSSRRSCHSRGCGTRDPGACHRNVGAGTADVPDLCAALSPTTLSSRSSH